MKYFGTDGIRQSAEKFTADFLANMVKGFIKYAGENAKVLIGGDTRESTEWIIQDIGQALESFGVEYASVSVLPTPAINYCFYQMGFDYAIDVTASHNPYTDNGIKLFERGDNAGMKLSEKGCACIEESLENPKPCTLIAPSLIDDIHREAVSLYCQHLRDYIGESDFSRLKIGMDCANGATSVINKTVFEEFGATVELINADASYGTIINAGCGSTHLDQLKNLVAEKKLDFGIAFDGDGDRCLMIDHTGAEIDGDQIIAILSNYLKLDKIAVTVMANQGLLNWAKEARITTEITAVGDSNVAEAMRAKQIKIGGEQSGHIILPGEPTGDGMLTALMVTKVISQTNQTLHELAQIYRRSPQVIVNLDAAPEQKVSLKTKPEVKQLLLDYSKTLEKENGRLLVRPSGTEPLVRITMWGNDETMIADLANELKNKLEVLL